MADQRKRGSLKRLCTICARGGSKGVKGKNLKPLAGKPLIAHSIEQALQSLMFEAVAVSSDSDEILDTARQFGAKLLIKRPFELASDEAPKMPAIRHCAKTAEEISGEAFDIIADLDATSPLRNDGDIKGAIALLEESGADNVISGTQARRSPYFNLVELDENGVVHLCKPPKTDVTRRQDAPPCYDMNASIYVWRRSALFSGGDNLFGDKTRLFIMPDERSLDIDSEIDWRFVDFLMAQRNK